MHDFHVHSNFSPDSKATMARMVQKGIQMGLKEICFTDHVEFQGGWVFDVNKYEQEIQRLRNMYKNQIQIRMGAEIGYEPQNLSRMNEFATSADFDFIMCSLHRIDGVGIHSGAFAAGKTPEQAFAKYFETYYQCVKDDPIYSVLGHFDLLKRYVPYHNHNVFKDNYDVIRETFKLLIENGKGIEVNASGFRYKLNHTLPTLDFLKLYKELGGEIITTGSDSHSEAYVAHKFDYEHALLKQAGFNYYTRFEKMQPHFVKLESEPRRLDLDLLRYA